MAQTPLATQRFCNITISLCDDSKGGDPKPTYHPGDLLTGNLWIHHGDSTIVDDVVLLFEGVTRIWVDHDSHASAVQYDFLKQSQRFYRHERKVDKAPHGKYCYMPFEFRIASRCFPNNGLDPQMSGLPPSLAAGEVSLDRHGNKCMQPLITYGLRAVIFYRPGVRSPRLQCREFREVTFSPWTEAAPPVSIDDFPGEFRLRTTTDLRKRLSRCSFGELAISIREPPPLISSTDHKGRTRGLLELSLRSPKLLANGNQPPHWSCEIRLEVIRKTFYSTMPIAEVASKRLMKRNEYLRSREEVVDSQTWTIDPLSWDRLQKNSCCTASIPLTIAPKRGLLPTFSIPLVTLRYSFRTSIRILQVNHSVLEVEAPLQVHSCRRATDNSAHDLSSNHDEWPNSIESAGTDLPPAYYT